MATQTVAAEIRVAKGAGVHTSQYLFRSIDDCYPCFFVSLETYLLIRLQNMWGFTICCPFTTGCLDLELFLLFIDRREGLQNQPVCSREGP